METKQLKRIFVYTDSDKKDIELADPNPNMTPEEVLDHYSGVYPKLTNSVIIPGKEKDGNFIYKIKDNFGPKG